MTRFEKVMVLISLLGAVCTGVTQFLTAWRDVRPHQQFVVHKIPVKVSSPPVVPVWVDGWLCASWQEGE